MIYPIFERLESKISLLYPIVAFALFLLMLWLINGSSIGIGKMKKITNGIGILDMQPGYSVDKAYSILDQQGVHGRAYYLKKIIPLDFIFPCTYMLFYCSLTLYLLKLLHPKSGLLHWAAIAPICATLFDYFENLAIIRLLLHFPNRLAATARIANAFTVLKFAFIYISVALLVVLISACFVVFIRVRASN